MRLLAMIDPPSSQSMEEDAEAPTRASATEQKRRGGFLSRLRRKVKQKCTPNVCKCHIPFRKSRKCNVKSYQFIIKTKRQSICV